MRVLDEGDWAEYRDVRLAALKESPEAFVATYEEESALDEEAWRERMRRSRRLVAASGGTRGRRRQRRPRRAGGGQLR